MTDQVLEDLPYDELRDRAFGLAERRRDFGFFVDLLSHTSALGATADEGGSLGEIGGSITETIQAARQVFGRDGVGELEPLFRARFATYLREHS
ncbi:MAG TPA: hypothetical protein VFN19_04825 [Candidatus Nanopelagicales bacterium]|jgi:hypothetical protein|nr:hypothetical protein [Candidatus Nanopelagicales bacterium]